MARRSKFAPATRHAECGEILRRGGVVHRSHALLLLARPGPAEPPVIRSLSDGKRTLSKAALSSSISPIPPSPLVSAPRSHVLCPLFGYVADTRSQPPPLRKGHERGHSLRNTATTFNTATPPSRTQFARLRQQLHHFRHRIAKDDPRRPNSPVLQVDEVTSVGCVPQLAGLIRKQRPNRPPAIAPLLKIPFGGYPAVVAAELAVHRGGMPA